MFELRGERKHCVRVYNDFTEQDTELTTERNLIIAEMKTECRDMRENKAFHFIPMVRELTLLKIFLQTALHIMPRIFLPHMKILLLSSNIA